MKDGMAPEGASDSVSMADHMWTRDRGLATEMRLGSDQGPFLPSLRGHVRRLEFTLMAPWILLRVSGFRFAYAG